VSRRLPPAERLAALGAVARATIDRLERAPVPLALLDRSDASLAASPLVDDRALEPLLRAPFGSGLGQALTASTDRLLQPAAATETGSPPRAAPVARERGAASEKPDEPRMAPGAAAIEPPGARRSSAAVATREPRARLRTPWSEDPAIARLARPVTEPRGDGERARGPQLDRQAARAWLAERADRTGSREVLARPLTAGVPGDDGAAVRLPDGAIAAPREPMAETATALDALLARVAPRREAGPGAAAAGDGERAPARVAPALPAVLPPAVLPAARPVTARLDGAVVADVERAAGPALAAPPLASASPLRRFALLAEAQEPPAPATPVAAPGARPVTPTSRPLDDADLADRIDRLLRREARREGLDLDP
jgi:hypothetical protein